MIYDWLQHIKFVWPENFLLMALIPFLIWRYLNKEQSGRPQIITTSVRNDTPTTFKVRFRHLPFILRMIAVMLLVTALARPQHQTDMSRTEGEGIDIVMCMDVSSSMYTPDIKPYRFLVAKEMAMEFVKSRPLDRIGLVIFAGESFTKCPLTPDKDIVLQQLQSLRIKDGGYMEDGTLIGEGLATSVNRIAKGSSKSKVIILLTDGKEDAPPTRLVTPQTALEIAKADHVKVYCIGMGAKDDVASQTFSQNGIEQRNFIDEDLLKTIATQTGGRYYRATDRASLQSIYSQIDSLEKTKAEIIKYKDITEMFIPLVLAALLLLFLELLLRYTMFRTFP